MNRITATIYTHTHTVCNVILHVHITECTQLVEAETLTEIFRGNSYLCGKITDSEVSHFVHCIEKSRNVKYLRFLQTIVQGGKEGQGSRRVQEMIMSEVCSVCEGRGVDGCGCPCVFQKILCFIDYCMW